MSTLEKILLYATLAVGCAIAVLNILAPITKSNFDNKLLDFLRKFEELILKALVPQMRAVLKDEKAAADAEKADAPQT